MQPEPQRHLAQPVALRAVLHAAAERRAAGGTPERRKGSPGPIGWLVLAMFGLLLMTAAIQTARTETERQSSRESLVSQIEQGREELDEVRSFFE